MFINRIPRNVECANWLAHTPLDCCELFTSANEIKVVLIYEENRADVEDNESNEENDNEANLETKTFDKPKFLQKMKLIKKIRKSKHLKKKDVIKFCI